MTKSAKKHKKQTKKIFSWEYITASIFVIISAIVLFNCFRTPVFKIDTKTRLLQGDVDLARIPIFDEEESRMRSIEATWFDAININISNMDLSGLGDNIRYVNFDSNSRFPSADKLPVGFNPEAVLKNGKNPGLGIRDLHAKGITGKGITVAIIDNGFNINHQEIKDNLIHYEIIGKAFPHYHGAAVSSLLCGKTVGVAPDAKLVYFATGIGDGREGEKPVFGSLYISNDIAALKKILEMNKKLPKDKKISAVSISRGWYNNSELFPEFKDVVEKLEQSGVMVLSVDANFYYGDTATIGLVDRMPGADPDDINSYKAHAGFECAWPDKVCLLAPAGGRTTAGNFASDYYRYWGKGGNSWAVPYIVGTWALAKQVYPDIKSKEFFEIARKTGHRLENLNGGYSIVIQPTKIIEYLQNKNTEQK